MGHQTWYELLCDLVFTRDGNYRSDPDRNEARLDAIEDTLRQVIEKLMDNPATREKSRL